MVRVSEESAGLEGAVPAGRALPAAPVSDEEALFEIGVFVVEQLLHFRQDWQRMGKHSSGAMNLAAARSHMAIRYGKLGLALCPGEVDLNSV